jgi:hypothetical protein
MNVEQLSPEEVDWVLKKLQQKKSSDGGLGVSFRGHVSAVCREEKTGEEIWKLDQHNVITEWMRIQYFFGNDALYQAIIMITPCTETPDARRWSVGGSVGADVFNSSWLTATLNNVDHSHTFSYVFGTPSVNHTVGNIGITNRNSIDWYAGAHYTAYSLVTPPKFRTTSQTLEVTYKIFMQAIG